jgi:hypothetical protein
MLRSGSLEEYSAVSVSAGSEYEHIVTVEHHGSVLGWYANLAHTHTHTHERTGGMATCLTVLQGIQDRIAWYGLT